MKIKGQINLTEGPILKVLAGLAMPIMASSFLATAYNITDMAWIGSLGADAVAGVGVAGMYVWLSQGLASLARMGGQVYVAQCVGRGEREQARKYAAAALQLTIVFALLFAAVCLIFTGPLIALLGIKDEVTLHYAEPYMKITCGLLLFPYLNMVLIGIYTAQGDSKTPFAANFVGLIINLVLDPLLILGIGPFPRMETTGAAIATVFAQAVATVILVARIYRAKDEQNILKSTNIFQRVPGKYFRAVCKIGGPTALQGTLYSMFSMVLTRMVAGFGAGAVAIQRVGGQIESISWNTADGFASALNAFCGQNFGAGKMQRVRKGYRVSFTLIALWGLLITGVFICFPEPIARIFFHEQEVIRIAVNYLQILGVGEAFMCVELVAIGAISGLGNTKLCSKISILLTGLRIPLAFVLSRTSLGLSGIWWALTLTSVMKGCVLHLAFYRQCTVCEKQ